MRWLHLVLLTGCLTGGASSPADTTDPPAGTGVVEVTLADLQPGWRVTTSRIVVDAAPVEDTLVSDGTPLVVVGTSTDVFVATITDGSGALVRKHAMASPCTMAASRQLHVPRDYPTIQAAVDAARAGETVRVAAGTYTESITMRPGVCLLGAGAKRSTLDAHGQAINLIDLSSAPGSVVAGFTFRGVVNDAGCAFPSDPFVCSGEWYRAGIYLGGTEWEDATHDAPPLILHNVFEANDIGVMFSWRGVAVVRNNVFATNRVGFVANHFQDHALVANNVFVDNTELAIGNQAAYLDIVDNVILGSQIGILFQYIQTGHIACNVFWNNAANQADRHVVPPRFTIGQDGNVEAEPKLVGNGDYHLQPGSPAKDTGCHGARSRDPDDTLPDIGAYGGPLATWLEDTAVLAP